MFEASLTLIVTFAGKYPVFKIFEIYADIVYFLPISIPVKTLL